MNSLNRQWISSIKNGKEPQVPSSGLQMASGYQNSRLCWRGQHEVYRQNEPKALLRYNLKFCSGPRGRRRATDTGQTLCPSRYPRWPVAPAVDTRHSSRQKVSTRTVQSKQQHGGGGGLFNNVCCLTSTASHCRVARLVFLRPKFEELFFWQP